MIKKKYLYAFIIFIIQVFFLIIKNELGVYTPDEILYTTGVFRGNEMAVDTLSLKFRIPYLIISFLYNINVYLYPLILISFTVITYFYIYKINRTYNVFKIETLLLFFLLPSAIYLSSAYLRDYLIYLLSITMLFNYKAYNLSIRTIIAFILLSILRYEAGIIILLSYILILFNKNKCGLFIKKRNFTFPFVIFFLLFSLGILINIDFIWHSFIQRLDRLSYDSSGFGLMHIEPTKHNILFYSIPNWFAYYAPYLFKEDTSLFSNFMLLESIIVGILFIVGLLKVRTKKFTNDILYQISYIILIGTFFLSILEVTPETAFRHRMAYIPFLIYLNFSRYDFHITKSK